MNCGAAYVRGSFPYGGTMNRQMTDREVYPAAWVTVSALTAAFLIWKCVLHAPTVSGCWVYRTWHIYCPGCGGTRALMALAKGHLLQALWYHPVVPVAAIWTVVYLSSQTLWRLRGKSGWTLHYDLRWPKWLLWLLALNWIVKIFLLVGFGIEL